MNSLFKIAFFIVIDFLNLSFYFSNISRFTEGKGPFHNSEYMMNFFFPNSYIALKPFVLLLFIVIIFSQQILNSR